MKYNFKKIKKYCKYKTPHCDKCRFHSHCKIIIKGTWLSTCSIYEIVDNTWCCPQDKQWTGVGYVKYVINGGKE